MTLTCPLSVDGTHTVLLDIVSSLLIKVSVYIGSQSEDRNLQFAVLLV